MATLEHASYRGYDRLLDAVGRTGQWWRTVYILERVLIYATVLFAAVLGLTLLEAHVHWSAAARWPLCVGLFGYAIGGAVLLVFRPLFRDWTEEQVAVHIERTYPELDNELINAIQLGRDDRVVSPGMVEALVAHTARDIERYRLRKSVDTRRARWLAGAACVATALLAVWAGMDFARFSNAFQRLVFPGRDIMPLGSVRILDVKPGDTSLNSGSVLEVRVATEGDASEAEAIFLYRPEGSEKPLAKTMSRVKRDLYLCRLQDVRQPLGYHVNIGGTESERYQVEVIEPPVIVRRDLFYDFPAYTEQAGWEDRLESKSNGDIQAPVGTVVTLTVTANMPVAHGRVQFGDGEARKLAVLDDERTELQSQFRVLKSDSYTVHVAYETEDGAEIPNREPRECAIKAIPDKRPVVEFLAPGKNVTTTLDSTVKLVLHAEDDYGISAIRLYAQKGKDGPQRQVKEWTEFIDPTKIPALPFHWDLRREDGYAVGDQLIYYAAVLDNRHVWTDREEQFDPQRAETAQFSITIEDKEKAAKEKAETVSTWETELRQVLEDQIAARNFVASLQKEDQLAVRRKASKDVTAAQMDIVTRTEAIAKKMKPEEGDERTARVKNTLMGLAVEVMIPCVKLAQGIPRLDDPQEVAKAYDGVASAQDEIIKVLRRILQIFPELAEDVDKDKMDEEDVDDFPAEDEEALRDLARNLKEMVRDQKKVVETTDELAKLPMEDFTPEDEKKLEEIRAIEEKWSQFLKATISDLSKMQDQDFANTTLIPELIEIHSEIEMAKDALSKKATEIATALEDNGLMLAEKLTKQLEKWLPDTPDRDRWQMEEPLTDGYETPMAELPKELEDIVGDLMEEEEDLQQEIEDATSAWSDSMDAAGWDAMDGPISNFAANGVTGNRLPNTSELSGRSGEGRQGKSVGEFVEDQFDGKGGRRTPTRLTSEDYQKGQIKDTSSTPPGGATGGGKAGGGSGEGLEGPPPPEVQAKLQGLALKQAQIRNTAEQIGLKFEVLNYPPVFEPVIKDMRALESTLSDGRYHEVRRRHNVLLKKLKRSRMVVEGRQTLDRDRTPTLPAHLQDEITDTAGVQVPEEFRDYLRHYYEAISKVQ